MTPFIDKNDGFTCKNCGTKNPPATKSCRNHCRKCLYSLHVDDKGPGDRASDCQGLMEPTKPGQSGKKGWIIYHKCQKCGKIISNKLAEDDNFEAFIKLTNALEVPRT